MANVGGGGGGGYGYHPSPPPFPFHLLELTIVSAQDLFPAVRSSMRTYAVAFVDDPDHKLRTRLDPVGHTDPSWNDKFVFRLDDATLRSDTASVTVDVYAARSRLLPGSDKLLGTARALLSTLHPSTTTRFVALQVRRPSSLRPQGILNLGVALIDAHVKSMPLCADSGGRRAGKAAAAKEVKLVRSKSMKEVERKLHKWRGELPLVEGGDSGKDKKENKEGRGVARKGVSQRTTSRKSCFCVEPEAKEDGGEGRGGARHP